MLRGPRPYHQTDLGCSRLMVSLNCCADSPDVLRRGPLDFEELAAVAGIKLPRWASGHAVGQACIAVATSFPWR